MSTPPTFSAMSAAQRANSVLDRGTFSPSMESTAATSLVVGSGRLAGAPVLVAMTDGHVRGGTIGVHEASVLARLAETAMTGRVGAGRPVAFIIGFDTGGVRVEEGPMALAAASAGGVALARLTLLGVPAATVISGPRGCFGATAVMAALPQYVVMTEGASWGLTGPKILDRVRHASTSAPDGLAVTSAASRLSHGDAQAVVPDTAAAVRAQLQDFLAAASEQPPLSLDDRIDAGAERLAALHTRWQECGPSLPFYTAPSRRRDLLRYSFRGQWKPSGPTRRRGLAHAALGTLDDHPALTLIVGPEQGSDTGIGIEEAAVVTEMIRLAVRTGHARTAILTFLFCQGHAVDAMQERCGLPRALAECLRAMVGARLRGHPVVSVLGGGTYGAAYLALAAPSHRILAMRGTSVAPMAPQVLRAFQELRGRKAGHDVQLAELVPDIRMVESVIRLPRVLRAELRSLLATVRPEVNAA